MRDVTRPRVIVLRVLVVSLLATLAGRLWVLQVHDGSHYRSLARNNQVRDIVRQPPRGQIVDDQGRPLIDNRIALVVKVNREKLIDGTIHGVDQYTATGDAVMRRLARVLHTSARALKLQVRLCSAKVPKPCWYGSPYEPIPVTQLTPSQKTTREALQITETRERFPGVTVQTAAVRHYPKPDGALASSVLGYIGQISPQQLNKLPVPQRAASVDAQVGKSGLEAEYEKYLHGRPGIKEVAVNAQGNATGTLKYTPPKPGDTLVTNLDAKVQARLEQSLKTVIAQQRSQGQIADYAAGVVLNVRTGGVVAMASEPTYPPQLLDESPLKQSTYDKYAHMKGSPLYDKAYEGASPPGSTFKLITASGILWDKIFSTGQSEDCSADFQGRHNFEGEVGGIESLHQAIVQSCDTWFYRVAAADWQRDQDRIKHHQKPIEGVQHIAHDYGLGEDPGIDLPNANDGYIPDRQSQKQLWKDYIRKNACAGAKRRPKGSELQRLDEYNCKFGYIFQQGDQENEDTGQGMVTVSPLQLAVAYAAIANGGTVWKPTVGKAIVSPGGKVIKRIHAKVRDHLPLNQADQSYIRDALYGVTTEQGGTGAGLFGPGLWPQGRFKVWGKTGTAELGTSHGSGNNGCWFASFAGPAGGKPQFVTVVELDKGTQGADAAAPAVKMVWQSIFGVQGQKAIFPDGVPPKGLPHRINGTRLTYPKSTSGPSRSEHGHHGGGHHHSRLNA